MRFHATACSSFHNPAQPGVMRPSADTQVISPNTSPAPPSARLPRCTRWKSPGIPSTAEYMAIGDTTMRLGSLMPRSRKGVSIGGTTGSSADTGTPQRPANQRS